MKREFMRKLAADRVDRIERLKGYPSFELLREQYIDQQMSELEAIFGKPED